LHHLAANAFYRYMHNALFFKTHVKFDHVAHGRVYCCKVYMNASNGKM